MSALGATVLVLLVLACWLAAAGFVRLRAATDRMHCVSFVNAAAGAMLVLYALLQDGASARFGKLLVLVTVALVTGAALSHATGRVARFRRREWR